MGGDGRRHLSLPVVVAQARRTGNALSARLRTARLSLPAVLLLAAATFFLGRASGAGKVHLPHGLSEGLHAFADASHQALLREGHLLRRSAIEDAEPLQAAEEAPLASPLLDAAAPPAAVPAGAHGNNFVSTIPFQVLSWEPRALYFPGFADPERCRRIVEIASKRLGPSSLALRAGDTHEGTADVRTSKGTFLTRREDEALAWLEDRIAEVTHIPTHHYEPYNVLRYEVGEKYDSHYDTFDPESYGPQASQRIISFLVYLNEWEEGGETVFLLEGPDGLARLSGIDYRACDKGLTLKPMKTGDALLFYNVHPNMTFDKHSLHGGCPVKKGTKWVATKWIRDKSFGMF